MGQIPHRARITNISTGVPCEVTTDGEHGFTTLKFVRLTELNGMKPIPSGEDELNNHRYRIVVTDVDKFILQDPISFKAIDSSNYPPYVSGGSANLIEQDFFYHSTNEEQ